MNYAESFQEFSSRLSTTDLMVYGGAALVLFVLFKDKLTPLKDLIINTYNSVMNKVKNDTVTSTPVTTVKTNDNDFLKLISSWKNTRDLAEKMRCPKAVEVLDGAFPYLSPNVCHQENK
jgi:hypothetical protein